MKKKATNKCSHKTESYRWVEEDDGYDFYSQKIWSNTGRWITEEKYTYVDLDIGRFQCTQCGEIGYYTGQWREYWEGKSQ